MGMITKHAPNKYTVKAIDADRVRLNVKADGDAASGTLEGYASVFGNVDLGNDVIRKGAFAKTLAEAMPKGAVKLMDSHAFFDGTGAVIGILKEAKEDDTGLWFKAIFSAVQRAQDVRTKVLEGVLNSLSIGFDILAATEEIVNGISVRMITEVKLYEISVVTWGMNPEAAISGAKALTAPLSDAEHSFLSKFSGCLAEAKALLDNAPTPSVKAYAERIVKEGAIAEQWLKEHAALNAPAEAEQKALAQMADLVSTMRLYARIHS